MTTEKQYELHGASKGIIFEDNEGEPWYCERVTMTYNAVVDEAEDYFQEHASKFEVTKIFMRYIDEDPNEEIEMELPTWLICAEGHTDAVPFWKIEFVE
jgi:hypothetical protein